MKSTKSAGRYAKALLELALDQDKLAPIEADMLQLIKLADEANDFQIFKKILQKSNSQNSPFKL